MVARTSRLRQVITTIADRTPPALSNSHIVASAKSVTNYAATVTRNSSLYRWLTAEPDPEIIVIDLRDTHTVGPLITLLDKLIDLVAPAYRQSRIKVAADAATALAAHIADTRLGRLLVTLLEPPEPPEADTPSQPDTQTNTADRPDQETDGADRTDHDIE